MSQSDVQPPSYIERSVFTQQQWLALFGHVPLRRHSWVCFLIWSLVSFVAKHRRPFITNNSGHFDMSLQEQKCKWKVNIRTFPRNHYSEVLLWCIFFIMIWISIIFIYILNNPQRPLWLQYMARETFAHSKIFYSRSNGATHAHS